MQPFGYNTPTLRTARQTGQTTVRQHRANRFTNGRLKTVLVTCICTPKRNFSYCDL